MGADILPAGFTSSKNHRAACDIARVITRLRLGDRIPTVDALRDTLGVGTGTVQSALRQLQQTGAVVLRPQQGRGTYIVRRDLGTLWRLAELGNIVGLLPLPNSREFQGLVSGLRTGLEDAELPLALMYAHGSQRRFEALRTGRADFTVMSARAAESHLELGDPIDVILQLGPGTYYAQDSVVVMACGPRESMPANPRVGIDPDSYDHTLLTKAEFPAGHYVAHSYGLLPSAIRAGKIDLAVWHRTALGLSLADQGLVTWPLARPAALELAESLSGAAVVIRRHDENLRTAFDEVDANAVREVQQAIVDGEVIPLY